MTTGSKKRRLYW